MKLFQLQLRLQQCEWMLDDSDCMIHTEIYCNLDGVIQPRAKRFEGLSH